MAIEIPTFTKCCFCVPMRPGLLTWAYLRLISNAIVFGLIFYMVSLTVWNDNKLDIIAIFVILFLALNFTFSIIFVVAVHKKHLKLLNVFYWFAMVSFWMSVVLSISMFYLAIPTSARDNGPLVIDIVLQGYLLMLLRSHLLELKSVEDSSKYRAVEDAKYVINFDTEKKGFN